MPELSQKWGRNKSANLLDSLWSATKDKDKYKNKSWQGSVSFSTAGNFTSDSTEVLLWLSCAVHFIQYKTFLTHSTSSLWSWHENHVKQAGTPDSVCARNFCDFLKSFHSADGFPFQPISKCYGLAGSKASVWISLWLAGGRGKYTSGHINGQVNVTCKWKLWELKQESWAHWRANGWVARRCCSGVQTGDKVTPEASSSKAIAQYTKTCWGSLVGQPDRKSVV